MWFNVKTGKCCLSMAKRSLHLSGHQHQKGFIMNYLAHAFLSFHQPALITGNLIADYVKGQRQLALYSPGVQQGIRLHRAIDTFTDQHPVTARAKAFFRPAAGLYSGVFTDLVYDHFLATDSSRFSEDDLYDFSKEVYHVINTQQETLPERFLEMFEYMQQYNWLYHYRSNDGMERAFRGVSSRARGLASSPAIVFAVFIEHYEALKRCYQTFFPDLQTYVENLLQNENR
jgi:acyl carrier protein phosphodiesterase